MASSCLGGFLLFVAVFSVSPVIVPGELAGGCSCPPLWTAFGDKCYRYFSTKNVTWFEAQMICRQFSVPCSETGSSDVLGHLTSVHSRKEMDFLSALYDSVRYKWDTNAWVWIGMHDIDDEGAFVWTDGSPVDYTYWRPNEPNSAHPGEDCVAFRYLSQFKWYDYGCGATNMQALICKLPKW